MPRRLDRTAAVATLLVAACASFLSAQSGALILVGGTILTQDASRPLIDAVAIRDGRVVAVGRAADADPWAPLALARLTSEGRR